MWIRTSRRWSTPPDLKSVAVALACSACQPLTGGTAAPAPTTVPPPAARQRLPWVGKLIALLGRCSLLVFSPRDCQQLMTAPGRVQLASGLDAVTCRRRYNRRRGTSSMRTGRCAQRKVNLVGSHTDDADDLHRCSADCLHVELHPKPR